jgi:hypothetical protein
LIDLTDEYSAKYSEGGPVSIVGAFDGDDDYEDDHYYCCGDGAYDDWSDLDDDDEDE